MKVILICPINTRDKFDRRRTHQNDKNCCYICSLGDGNKTIKNYNLFYFYVTEQINFCLNLVYYGMCETHFSAQNLLIILMRFLIFVSDKALLVFTRPLLKHLESQSYLFRKYHLIFDYCWLISIFSVFSWSTVT